VRALAGALLCAGSALALSACSEAAVTHATPKPALTFAVPTLPPIGFNHRYGNNPVAAADAFATERAEYARKEYWEVAIRADPYTAGFTDTTDPAATRVARASFTKLLMVIASESVPTLRAMVLLGDKGQQAYCQRFVDDLRALGYTGLTSASVLVFFGEADRHAQLTWSAQAGYAYTIYDNNLNGALTRPIPTATPFATPPQH